MSDMDLKALKELFDRHPFPSPPQEGDYAELIESLDDPSLGKDVITRRKDGTPVMRMALEDWDAFRGKPALAKVGGVAIRAILEDEAELERLADEHPELDALGRKMFKHELRTRKM